MKARFTKQQHPVSIVRSDNKIYIFLCLNETQGTETYPDMGDGQTTETYYEYDYNEIIAPADAIPLDDIQTHPENYLDYIYKPSATLEERVAALERNQSELDTIFTEVVNETGIL